MAAALLVTQMPAPQDAPERTIQVTGTGVVQTPPDIALLEIYLRGEGDTPDAATSALAAKQKAVTGGIAELLGTGSEVTTSNVTVIEARSPACADAHGYGSQPRISTGDCAVVGYIATMQESVRATNVGGAGTAVGLASRLGASDARLQGYVLTDTQTAQRQANAAAIAMARQHAEAIAGSAGVRLGPIVTVRDQASYDVVVTGSRVDNLPPAPPPPPRESPVVLDTKPRPIETRTQVYVTYAIAQ